jgi:hypothetical protein
MNYVKESPGFFIRYPRLFVFFAFGLLVTAWSALIPIAIKHGTPDRREQSQVISGSLEYESNSKIR